MFSSINVTEALVKKQKRLKFKAHNYPQESNLFIKELCLEKNPWTPPTKAIQKPTLEII